MVAWFPVIAKAEGVAPVPQKKQGTAMPIRRNHPRLAEKSNSVLTRIDD
jgi:hypothetical protein